MMMLFQLHVEAQNNAIIDINAQLRALFSPLTRPSPSKWFLYDMAAHVSDTDFFNPNCPDTLEPDMWYAVYEEMYHMAYDTVPFDPVDTVFAHGNGFQPDTLPIGIMNYYYYRFKPAALTTNQYFYFDTINDILTDIPGRPDEPYLTQDMFCASPLVPTAHFTNPVFHIDPAFILFDSFHSNIYNTPDYRLEIDFGDGLGWIQFDPTVVTDYQVFYHTGGEQVLHTRIIDKKELRVIYSSTSRIWVISNTASVLPDKVLHFDGITAGLYNGCNAKGLMDKLVIYLSGFDMLDFIPSQNRTAADIYSEMISNDKIVQLKNDGYSFLVVDWDNSRIDIRFNALYLVNLLEHLKCDRPADDQFVIFGESMGGLVGRYALTYMETEYYRNYDNKPFFVDAFDPNNALYLLTHPDILKLPKWRCHREKMHNTRLFVTLDTPHQGANIPMSIQHAYRTALGVFGPYIGTSLTVFANGFNMFLDGQAAQQMLIYHVDTKSGPGWFYNYSSHPDKISFFNQLASLGNYPQYAKVLELSNGSLSGENQTNYYNSSPRYANDRLIDFKADLYARVLWLKLPIFGGSLLCRTNPAGNGHIFHANAGWYKIKIKLKWFGIKINIGYNSLLYKDESANMLPYCTSAGGWTGDPNFVNPVPGSNGFNLSNNYWILNFFHYSHTVDGNGCVNFDSHLGWNGFLSANFDYSLCSDGLHFCFVPVQSALDYSTLGTNPLNLDLVSTPITTKLSNTPADAIMGYHESGPYSNRGHLNFRHPDIYNLTQNPSPNPYYSTYYSCIGVNNIVERGLLNLEVGDEELYLENVTLPWKGDYQAEFDIHANARNPYWEYPGYIHPSLNIKGCYSKDDPYIIDPSTGQATFYYDGVYSPTTIGMDYQPPFTGPYIKIDQPQKICCANFLGSRLEDGKEKKHDSFLMAYPNPNDGSQVMLNFRFANEGPVYAEICSIYGEKLMDKLIFADGSHETVVPVNISDLNLANGVYLLRVHSKNEMLSSKIVISN